MTKLTRTFYRILERGKKDDEGNNRKKRQRSRGLRYGGRRGGLFGDGSNKGVKGKIPRKS